MASVKGSKISSKLAFVRAEYDDGMAQRVVESMNMEDRAQLRSILDLQWYSLELYDRVLIAICEVAAGSDETVYDRLGNYSAEHQLAHIYSAYRHQDLATMAGKLETMHRHRNEPAEIEVVAEPNGWTLIVAEPKSMTPIACRVSRSFYRRTAELCGATHVTVIEPRCTSHGDDACRFEVCWR